MMIKSPEVIYLIDTGDGIVWCDDPDPTGYGECGDAAKYVLGDAYEALQAEWDALLTEVRGLREKVRYFEDTLCCQDIPVMISNGCSTMAIDPKRVADLVRERDILRAALRNVCDIYVIDDYYSGKLREEMLDKVVDLAINEARDKGNKA